MGKSKPTSGNPNAGTCYLHIDDIIRIAILIGIGKSYREIAKMEHVSYTTIKDVNLGHYDDWINEKGLDGWKIYHLDDFYRAIFPGASSEGVEN